MTKQKRVPRNINEAVAAVGQSMYTDRRAWAEYPQHRDKWIWKIRAYAMAQCKL